MSEAANTRHVRLIEPKNAETATADYYDKSWGMVIGIDDYQGEHPTLANARNDAAAFAQLLEHGYKFDQVFTLYDQAATCDTIMEWLRDKLPAQIGKNDRLVIFFAGHGTTRESGRGEKRGYLVPHDAQAGRYADYIDMSELRDACGWIPAKHILLILDCCFSGVAAIASRATPPLNQRVITDSYLHEITRRSAWQVLTAGASDELAADSGSRPGHSAFTSALLAGLEGQADQNGDGIITASELAGFVKPEVSRQSMGGRARGQTPFFNYLAGSDQGDFVFLRHDTPIKIQPTASTTLLGVSTPRLSPAIIGLGAILLLAVLVLGWLVWGALADNNVIKQRLAEYEATADAAATITAVANQTALAAATDAPPLTITALAAQQQANAIEVETRTAATIAAIAAGANAPDPNAKQPAVPSAPTATPTPPSPTATLTPPPTATTPAQRLATAFFYKASAGDTWASVAARYAMDEDELKRYNAAWLECTDLNKSCRTEPKVGDDLLIPGLNGETIIGRGTTYTLKAGENLFRVGVRAGYPLAVLVAANAEKLPNPQVVRSGTALYIPLPEEIASPAQVADQSTVEVAANDCTLVSDPPLRLYDHGQICLTNGKDLGLRATAGGDKVLKRIPNGSRFVVIGGPTCANYQYGGVTYRYFWWQVETEAGDQGWLVDGSEPDDPVYLCRHLEDAADQRAPIDPVATAEQLSAEVVQTITDYWSLWGKTAGCLTAWGMLSDSFKGNTSGLTQESYLQNCGRTQATVTTVDDLDPTSESVIERYPQCALVRVQLQLNQLSGLTFALIQSDPMTGGWQILFAREDHAEAQARAQEMCQ